MKVDYETEAHSLLFEFDEEFQYFENGDYVEHPGSESCIVWVHDDRPYAIELLGADEDIAPLDAAAERFGLDAEGLRAAALAALAAPDREISIEVGKHLAVEEAGREVAA